MSRLDDYRIALLASFPDVSGGELVKALDEKDADFPSFVIEHGLGPLWHERTENPAFYESRMQAEALYLAQEKALKEVSAVFDQEEIDYVVYKGAANRSILYQNQAVRACHDIDILVNPAGRVAAARILVSRGFSPKPEHRQIGHELELVRKDANVDLHWSLLRQGRLRTDMTGPMLSRRRKAHGLWMPGVDDVLFALLVHPAFAKHLEGFGMGLHRVADILGWLRRREFDWSSVRQMLASNGVKAAAWATLRWVELLAGSRAPSVLPDMLADLQPGPLRRYWIDFWLRHNLSQKASDARWTRLLGFSLFLHDKWADGLRVAIARRRAGRRSQDDLAVFGDLVD